MTPEELERVMNFIIERQERITQSQEQTQQMLAELARRDEDKEERIKRFERSYTAISTLLQKHDSQLDQVTTGLNELINTVNRYITARGSHGSGGDSDTQS